MRHIISVSGGKDSTATYLLALELACGDFDAVFADTGNEHPYTYEYVTRLHERTGGPKVQIVKADFSAELARKRLYLESGRATALTERPWTEERVHEVRNAPLVASGEKRQTIRATGKRRSGRLLDGREWIEVPEVSC